MVLDLDRSPSGNRSDAAETLRPRSLELALRRMGFRPPPSDGGAGAVCWRSRASNDPAPDWLPL